MGFRSRLSGTKLTFLSPLSATSGTPYRQCLFLRDFHVSIVSAWPAGRMFTFDQSAHYRTVRLRCMLKTENRAGFNWFCHRLINRNSPTTPPCVRQSWSGLSWRRIGSRTPGPSRIELWFFPNGLQRIPPRPSRASSTRLHAAMCASNACGGLALHFRHLDHRRLGAATDSIPLPESKPRAVRELFIVPSIRSREVCLAQRSGVRHREDALQPLDFSNDQLGVHPSQYGAQGRYGQSLSSPSRLRFVVLLARGSDCSTQPTCTASMEIEPPSTPSTGNVTGSDGMRVPRTYSRGR